MHEKCEEKGKTKHSIYLEELQPKLVLRISMFTDFAIFQYSIARPTELEVFTSQLVSLSNKYNKITVRKKQFNTLLVFIKKRR